MVPSDPIVLDASSLPNSLPLQTCLVGELEFGERVGLLQGRRIE